MMNTISQNLNLFVNLLGLLLLGKTATGVSWKVLVY